jgi:RIO-like serine/threonine protein kinase
VADDMEGPTGAPRLERIRLCGSVYTLREQLGEVGCSRVFRAERGDNEAVALKIFPRGKRAIYYDTRSTRNHFGQTRDVSRTGFDEIRAFQAAHPFLPKLIARERFCGAWILVMALVPGVNFREFIEMHAGNAPLLVQGCRTLGATLRQWHEAGFAHGDPNLGNAMIKLTPACDPDVRLIDVNMAHHSAFLCCRNFGCDHRRFIQDLKNVGRVGRGFLEELREIQAPRTDLPDLASAFLEGHDRCSRCR